MKENSKNYDVVYKNIFDINNILCRPCSKFVDPLLNGLETNLLVVSGCISCINNARFPDLTEDKEFDKFMTSKYGVHTNNTIRMPNYRISFVYPLHFTILLYANGKIVMTGISRFDKLQESLQYFLDCIKDYTKIANLFYEYVKLTNSVHTYRFDKFIDINKIEEDYESRELSKRLEIYSFNYLPEIFPGACIKMPCFTVKVYSAGIFVMVGVRKIDKNFTKAFLQVKQCLQEHYLKK